MVPELQKKISIQRLPSSARSSDTNLNERLTDLARREKVSLFDVYLAAFELLILRYTRAEENINIEWTSAPSGRPISGRLHSAITTHQTIKEALTAVSKNSPAQKQDVYPVEAGAFPFGQAKNWRLYWEDKSELSKKRWLSISFSSDSGSLPSIQSGEYFSDLGVRTESHWRQLLVALLLPGETRMGQIPLTDDDELKTVLGEGWSHVGKIAHPPATLTEIFALSAKRNPTGIAIHFREEKTSYADLDCASNRLARFLIERGIGPGCYVGLMLERSIFLYTSVLAILKSGAAYVPIDPSYPLDRIGYLLQNCGAKAFLTDSSLSGSQAPFQGQLICRANIEEQIATFSGADLGDVGPKSSDTAYVIYTSGTTGKPKGVEIEHKSAAYWAKAESMAFAIDTKDRVYQGFSLAFDASLEELWLTFQASATLVPAPTEIVRSGSGLKDFIETAQITVFSTVPTLLSMLEGDLPSVRILILGGEKCPADLVQRWTKPGRRLINSYGPTETTVVATYSDCLPEKRVTIGKPLPGYSVYVLDENLQPCPIGIPGELHIGGPCVARGYLGLPELTREKFISNPFSKYSEDRLYKTGDLVRFTSKGDLDFLGRIDGQIKLRGFRIELSEIEELMMQVAGVHAAVTHVREDQPGLPMLVSYVVTAPGHAFDEELLRQHLRQRLPSFMIPSFIEVLADLPRLPSGKIDKKALPPPRPRSVKGLMKAVPPETDTEKKIAVAWQKLFHPLPVSIHDDFFEIGGHSLLAARLVSELRREPGLSKLAIKDIYQQRTIAQLARSLDRVAEVSSDNSETLKNLENRRYGTMPSALQKFLGETITTVSLLSLFSLQLLLPWFASRLAAPYGFGYKLAAGFGGFIGSVFLLFVLSIAAKWLLIGRYRAGSYPLWSAYYWRFWFVRRLQAIVPLQYLRGSPLLPLYFRALGARIGKKVYLGTHYLHCFDLIQIGDNTSIGMDADLLGYTVENGQLIVGAIHLGKNSFVGTKAVVSLGAKVSDGAGLGDMSMMTTNSGIPEGEFWRGSPAEKSSDIRPLDSIESGEEANPFFLFALSHWALLLVLYCFPVIATIPSLLFISGVSSKWGYIAGVLLLPFSVAIFTLSLCLLTALAKWLVLGKVKAGSYSVNSVFYLRKWFVDCLMQMTLELLHPLYATIYLPPWFRLMGARLGKRVEISTVAHISPDLLSIGSESFLADSSVLGAPFVIHGKLHMAEVRIGRRTFVGNGALVPAKTKLPSSTLIGVLSVPPSDPQSMVPGSSWLGSPALFLPKRHINTSFSPTCTYRPTRKLFATRAVIEFFRITLPLSITWTALSMIFKCLSFLNDRFGVMASLGLGPAVVALGALGACGAVILLKWIIMGKYPTTERPLWSHFVWRNELVTALHESVSVPFLLNLLQGTRALPLYFRALGSRIGKRVFMETTQLTEFDLVEIGNGAHINFNTTIQTHLFEDRVMKTAPLVVGDNASIGSASVVLYGSHMGKGATLGSLSLLMKGEHLPPESHWRGSPGTA